MGTKLLATLDALTTDVKTTTTCLRSYNEEQPCPCDPEAAIPTVVAPREEVSDRVPLLAGPIALRA